MVRVNLLPDKRAGRGRAAAMEPSQLWLLGVVGALVVTIVVCLFIQKMKQDELAAIMAENGRTQGQIDAIKKTIANHAEIQARLKELREREEAIQKLEAARTGPTSTLLELAHLLTTGRGPTTDRDKLEQLKHDNPEEVYNQSWDARRLWLTSYNESERVVRISGLARDGDDVSEFERRLKLSDYFAEVHLLPGHKTVDDKSHQEVFEFQLSAKVKY